MTDSGGRRKVLVSAGPTREHVDPVRYLSNESSGRMGFAIAAAAAAAGHEVLLVAGPVSLPTPEGVTRVDVVSALDMLAALKDAVADADCLIMAAAVADYRPAVLHGGKWKAKESDGPVSIELVENPDILTTLSQEPGERLVIGFALETSDGERRALDKMARKGTDYIVLNSAAALNASQTTVTILGRDGSKVVHADQPKEWVAQRLVELLERTRA
ncbi:MAG: phosphopantothenoylcysteine decarboxylase/phosphopantothenate--cysteine ligase [Planctomycetota bacterium]|jgi:phosphopantothenoylcysteine decarboxylase/phosphopantothenate--cysteine ligase